MSKSEQVCRANRKDGEPCRAQALRDGLCLSHSPVYKERMAAARKKGGRNKSRSARVEKLMPRRLRPVFNLLARAMVETYEGGLDPRQANAMSSLAGAMVRVLVGGEIEERVRRLEEQAGHGGGTP